MILLGENETVRRSLKCSLEALPGPQLFQSALPLRRASPDYASREHPQRTNASPSSFAPACALSRWEQHADAAAV